jgi:hypothetical protein
LLFLSGRIHIAARIGDRPAAGRHITHATLALCALKALAGVRRFLLRIRTTGKTEQNRCRC